MKLLSPAPFIKFLFHVSSTLPRFTTNLNQVDFNKEKVNQLSQHTSLYLSLTFYFILFYPCMDFHTKMERLIIVIFRQYFSDTNILQQIYIRYSEPSYSHLFDYFHDITYIFHRYPINQIYCKRG